ncbi:MAG: hypothetical protein MUE81_15885 [Thermoflexibacter sp.]|jgi:hypothetical protein|nr:hypothetical protein [Thermoflexibacter sp.]
MNVAKELKSKFDNYNSFPIEFWDSISALGDTISVGKETTLKEIYKIENYLYFLLEGSGGILLWNYNNFVCTDMVLNNDFLCDYLSFITRKETPYEVIIFEKSVLFQISHAALTSYLNTSENGDKFWRFSTQVLYIDKHLQYIQSVTHNLQNIYMNLRIVL